MALDEELIRQAADKYRWNISFNGVVRSLEKERCITIEPWLGNTFYPQAALAYVEVHEDRKFFLGEEKRMVEVDYRRYGLLDLSQKACILHPVVNVFPHYYNSAENSGACRGEILSAVLDELKKSPPRRIRLELPADYRGAVEEKHIQMLYEPADVPRVLMDVAHPNGLPEVIRSCIFGDVE